jgi:hypothetical protein
MVFEACVKPQRHEAVTMPPAISRSEQNSARPRIDYLFNALWNLELSPALLASRSPGIIRADQSQRLGAERSQTQFVPPSS